MKKKFKQISLFSGIGGFDIASEWAGWETAAWCEWESYCQEILKYYWPRAKQFSDIKKSDFKEFENQIHVITGGFPCQPYSAAGKRLGKQDERHLWPEMCRVINEVKPNWIVGENVRGLLTWNGGIVFDEVCTDLENSGYDPIVFMIPAVAVDAPHRRDRVWFVAKRNDYTGSSDIDGYSFDGNDDFPRINWNKFPSNYPTFETGEIPNDVLNISVAKWRNGSIKAYGNAIVPQVVFELFKVMNKYESVLPNNNNWKSWFLNELISSDSWTRRYPVQWSQKVLMNRGYNSLAVNTKRKVQNVDDSSDLFLGTPRANEKPRSEKFLQKEQGINRVPTPSEFILSKDKMESLKPLSTEWGLLKTPCAADAYADNLSKKEQKMGNSGTLAQEIVTGFVEERWPGLLPTIKAQESNRVLTDGKNVSLKTGQRYGICLTQMAKSGLLPTPTTQEPTSKCEVTENGRRVTAAGNSHSLNLGRLAGMGILPTPTPMASDSPEKNTGSRNQDSIAKIAKELAGTTSQLNPEFVGEMMGFPPYWTFIPYIKQEQL